MEANGAPHIDSLSSPSAAGDADEITKLLDVLTEARFDPVSGWIVAWVNTECERDVRQLHQAVHLIFERAKDAPSARSGLYARLCRKMMEQISPNVRDESIKDAEGRPIGGRRLFCKYLLNRCQEDFERGWVASEAISAAAAQRVKRQGLGLIRFISELFKLQMLTERIMHECIKKWLGNVEHPEEEIESLCTLLTTVGQVLDTPKARAHMDVYFSRMKELKKSGNVNSRMQYMLQEIIELRERKWIPRNRLAAPMSQTIAAVYKQAAKEKLAQEKETFTRQVSMSPGGSRRGGERGDHAQVGPDGWAVSGGAAPRSPPKAGDLSKYGKIDKSAPMTFGPSSVFQKGDKSKSRESIIRPGNMFSMLSGNPEMASEVTGQSRRPPNRESSIDLGPGGVPDDATPPHRRKLQLLPTSVPPENKSESTPSASPVDSEEEPSGISSLFEAEAKIRIEKDSNEFFSTRDLQEAEVYFTKFPSKHQHLLVDKLVNRAIESKQADAQLVADLFDRAVSRNLCSPASFEEGFIPTAEIIDDIVIDAPNALDLFAIMIKGAHLDEDEERLTRLASKSMDSDKLVALLS